MNAKGTYHLKRIKGSWKASGNHQDKNYHVDVRKKREISQVWIEFHFSVEPSITFCFLAFFSLFIVYRNCLNFSF